MYPTHNNNNISSVKWWGGCRVYECKTVVYLGCRGRRGGGGWDGWGPAVRFTPSVAVALFTIPLKLARADAIIVVGEAACVAVLASTLDVEAAQSRPLPLLLGVQGAPMEGPLLGTGPVPPTLGVHVRGVLDGHRTRVDVEIYGPRGVKHAHRILIHCMLSIKGGVCIGYNNRTTK